MSARNTVMVEFTLNTEADTYHFYSDSSNYLAVLRHYVATIVGGNRSDYTVSRGRIQRDGQTIGTYSGTAAQ